MSKNDIKSETKASPKKDSAIDKKREKELKAEKEKQQKALKAEKEKKAKEQKAEKEKLARTAKAEKEKREKALRAEREKAKQALKSKNKNTSNAAKKDSGEKTVKYLGGFLFKKMAKGGAERLEKKAEEVNMLNVFPVPDGDTGDNMKMTIESGIAEMENVESDDLAAVMQALSHAMLLGARGNSGVILSQFFAGISKGLEAAEKADTVTLGHALEIGVKQAYSSVMTPTEGTILTVAREAVEYAVARITTKSTISSFFADLVEEMHRSLDRTPEILTVLKEAGVVDSGGAGLLYILEGFFRVLSGKKVSSGKKKTAAHKAAGKIAFNENSVMTYGYCTELLLQLQKAKTDIDAFDVDALKAFLVSVGDSVVAFKTESIVKLHVHTFTPEKVLAYCREYGEFLTVKIENMSVQHTETVAENAAEAPAAQQPAPAAAEVLPSSQKAPAEKSKYGVVAVGNGPGICNLFSELGADVVVKGGQTQNPSTNDFLEAFERINAEHIIVFPNNGNIVMAAQQAGDLYEKAKVHVIPSKSIGTGYVALSSVDRDNPDADAVVAEVTASIGRVNAGYISPAIRDAEMNGIEIHLGDTIGIIDREIAFSVPDKTEAAHKLATTLLDMPGKFMITVFSGVDASEAERAELEEFIKNTYPDNEVYFIDGGQEIYPYIFVAE